MFVETKMGIKMLLHYAEIGSLSKSVFVFSNCNVYSMNKWTNIRHVCTYLNTFFRVIPNMVTKCQNIVIFEHFNLDLSSAHACRVVSVERGHATRFILLYLQTNISILQLIFVINRTAMGQNNLQLNKVALHLRKTVQSSTKVLHF